MQVAPPPFSTVCTPLTGVARLAISAQIASPGGEENSAADCEEDYWIRPITWDTVTFWKEPADESYCVRSCSATAPFAPATE